MSSLTKFLKRHTPLRKETCAKRSLFIYDVFIYLTQEYGGHEVSEVSSKFSISSTGQNRKPGNLGNGHFFFSNHIVKLKFCLLGHVFDF